MTDHTDEADETETETEPTLPIWVPPVPTRAELAANAVVVVLYTLLLASGVLTLVGIVRNLGRSWANLKRGISRRLR